MSGNAEAAGEHLGGFCVYISGMEQEYDPTKKQIYFYKPGEYPGLIQARYWFKQTIQRRFEHLLETQAYLNRNKPEVKEKKIVFRDMSTWKP